jgi:hypothetical protein
MRETVLKLIPIKVLEKMASRFFVKEEINPTTGEMLQDFFRTDIGQLEKLLNKDLSHWK